MTSSLLSRLPSLAVLTAIALPAALLAQKLTVPGATTDSAARPAAIARLAGEAAAYRDTNRVVLLDNLFRLGLLAGRIAEADSRQRLLTPGTRARLDWRNVRLASHLCQSGSRIVMVIGGVRGPGQQINYGTGKNVSDETIADAGEPLTIRWSNRSYLDLPVWRPRPGAR